MRFRAGKCCLMARFRTFTSDRFRVIAVGAAVLLACPALGSMARQESMTRKGLGRIATEAEIRAWDIEVAPDGAGLPAGRGTVRQGARTYAANCAMCHGATGIEGPADKLAGGQGTLRDASPMKTVGSYWPYATTLYDYIYRAMPPAAPQSLSADEVYGLVAWILYRNGILNEQGSLDAKTLPSIQMPNRDGFKPDFRFTSPRSERNTE
jgi:mono/diheme cytochrome c family protein